MIDCDVVEEGTPYSVSEKEKEEKLSKIVSMGERNGRGV